MNAAAPGGWTEGIMEVDGRELVELARLRRRSVAQQTTLGQVLVFYSE